MLARKLSGSTGNPGCECIDESDALASLSERSCTLDDGSPGVVLKLREDACFSTSYGSSACLMHDMIHDPDCKKDQDVIPPYCVRPWCYVDLASCIKDSDEMVFRSSYFGVDSGVDVYFSYSTCNSTVDDWTSAQGMKLGPKGFMGGAEILANVPTYRSPYIHKRDSEGEFIPSVGPEYYDNSIPWEGAYIDLVRDIVELAGNDISSFNTTYKSRASGIAHPASSFTAAVRDIQNGLADMSIAPFWITDERLEMSAFTLPLVYDKTYLVVPKPGSSNSLAAQTQKVLQPFTPGLWGFVLVVIVVASLLGCWFAGEPEEVSSRLESEGTKPSRLFRAEMYARLGIDSFLEKGMWFFSAGVDHDQDSISSKFLIFGFGFFILISVSAYVANLASFLTLNLTNDVRTMARAVEEKYTICALPVLEQELETDWPDAKFFYHLEDKGFLGMLDDYAAKKCDALAVGYEDTILNSVFLEAMCKNNLVYTDSVVVEIPIAFPIRQDLSSGFSYWVREAKRNGIDLEAAKENYRPSVSCEIQLTDVELGGDEYAQITVPNMFFPIMFFVFFALLGIVLHLVEKHYEKKGERSFLSKHSSLGQSRLKNISGDTASSEENVFQENDPIMHTKGKYEEEDENYVESA